jgi:type VI secretion system protein ImpB
MIDASALGVWIVGNGMAESRQHTIDRVRKPRVHITYDVEVGSAIEKKELPFVVAVLADLSGQPESPLPSIKNRKFVEIDRDNFGEIMSIISPRLVIRVANRLSDENPETSIELTFSDMADFQPQRLAQNVPTIKTLYNKRNSFKNLIAKMDGNDKLEALLSQIMKNRNNLEKLKKELDDREEPPQTDAPKEQNEP